MRVLFILHGAKKELRKLPKILDTNRPNQHQFYYCYTREFGSGKQLAYEHAGQADLITVIGGDGLINECVNGLMIYKQEHPDLSAPAITLLPWGAGNDFARTFQWKYRDIPDFFHRLERWRLKEVDLGSIRALESGRVEYFLNEASAGISPKVIEFVRKMPDQIKGDFKYGLSIFVNLIRYKPVQISVKSKEFEWSGRSLVVACCNGQYFGSGLKIAPDADVNDGKMDMVVVGNVGMLYYLRHISKIRKGIKLIHPEIHYFQTNEVLLDGDSSIEKEGEPGSKLPCIIHIKDKMMILD